MANIYSLWTKSPLADEPGVDTAADAGCRDWTNQELADLFRVKMLLERAGVPLLLERGLSDEGEPWLVFCTVDDEVFIHLCRIDGQLLLDSPKLEEPLLGDGFDALVEAFVRRAALNQMASNVVPLRPRNGVYLHPAVMLTALVWSIYLSSSELMGMAEASGLDDDASVALLPHIALEGEQPSLDAALQMLNQTAADSRATAGTAESPGARTGSDQNQSGLGMLHGAITAAAVAASISVVAFNHGLLMVVPEDAAGPAETESVSLLSALPTLPEEDSVSLASTAHLDTTARPDAERAPEEVGHVADAVEVTPVPDFSFLRGVVEERVAALELADLENTIFASATPSIGESGLRIVSDLNISPLHQGLSLKSADLSAIETAFSELLTEFRPLYSYTFNGIDVLASVSPNLILSEDSDIGGGFSLVGEGKSDEQELGEVGRTFGVFDDAARAFLGFLISKNLEVEVIAFADELVFIDTTAFDEITDIAYARSWVFADGSIVSTVGNLNDFEAFGLA